MKNPFASKKGVAIEMSVIFLLTVFFLCAIIVMLSLFITHQGTEFIKEQNNRFLLDEMGFAFVSAVNQGYSADQITALMEEMIEEKDKQGEFVCSVNDSGQSSLLRVTRLGQQDDGKGAVIGTVLEVCIENNKVVRWAYN